MPEAFEEKKEEERKELKKKKKEFAPSELKTIMEIRDVRETARKGREIIARREGKYIEKEEDKDVKYPGVGDMLSSVPPKNPHPQAPIAPPPSAPSGHEDDRKDGKKKFEDMIRKMKKFLK